MDFDVLDEHEQGEVVQKWLRENAISIAVGVLLGLVLIFGWQQWKAHRLRHDAEAAAQYQALSDAAEAKRDDEVTAIAGVLRKDYPETVYSVLAAMYQADQASARNDLPAAATALGWAQEHAGVSSLKSLAALRLARVKLAQGDADGAIKLVDGVPKDEYSSLGGEIRGDAFAKLGRADDARAAYQDALSHLDPQAPNRSFVQMKLDDIAIATAKPPVPTEASAPAREKKRFMKRTLIIIAVLATTLSGCTWLKSLGKKDNVEPPTPLTQFTATTQIERLWTDSVGKGAGMSGARLAPGSADGRLYAAGIDGTVEAIDAANGRTIWQKHLGKRSGRFWHRGKNSLRWSGGPSVQGDLLVVGSLDGHVYALSAQDGADRWNAQMSSEVIAPPAIADGVVVVRSNDGRLVGLDAADGARKWIFEQPVPALSLRGNSAPLITNGAVYDGFDNGKVVAVRLADGNELWAQTLSSGEGRTEVERLSDVDGNMVSDGSALFGAGYRGQVAALALDSGRPLWQRDLSSYVGAAVSGNAVVSVDAEGNVWAFDRETGVNLWKQDQLKYRLLSAPAIQGKYVVVGDSEGYVHWLSLAEGKFAARERLSKKAIEGEPLVVDNVVYVEDVKGRIGAYRARQ